MIDVFKFLFNRINFYLSKYANMPYFSQKIFLNVKIDKKL